MPKKRRKLLFGLGVTSACTPWVKPLINHILLPVHAECSPALERCIALRPRIEVRNAVCVSGSPSTVTFELCNLENELITATSIDVTGQTFAKHVSPGLPFTIQPGGCMRCSAEGATTTAFDCNGNYSFGYIFTSESGKYEGSAGAVPLITPQG